MRKKKKEEVKIKVKVTALTCHICFSQKTSSVVLNLSELFSTMYLQQTYCGFLRGLQKKIVLLEYLALV